ncbi:FAD binding domain-containing protein [Acidisphaera rubrifaciens]|uniref:2,6-dihydroxypyridine 3-monooxygenase substrate binding domain-containing protein n=1 Tax=Acidisphaera rubrifaciens HS-AP3 TaxID=1231350 RepID=A0A0D6P2H2_9PROT|nr:FAD binding domain-containing protein [Acidisphaera rubrifaciens]GAN75857.1 hypothetical protein Asru_0010_05 [Acidisphaera rubrifaciens HS-AP3]
MTTTAPRRRALVIGGSIGGLFAAHALHRHGWDVQVFERSAAELSGRGAGIVTHPQLWQALAHIGLDPADRLGVPVARRVTFARDGRVIGSRPFPQVTTSWDLVFRQLRAAWPDDRYALGRSLVDVTQDDTGISARFADGTCVTGDVLIGADGLRSSVRQAVVGDVASTYAGYVAWRGLVAERDVPAAAHSDIFDVFGFCLPPGEQFLGYPVAGPGDDLRRGHRQYNFVWYRPADEATELPRLLRDATGHVHTVSIPPPLIRDAIIDEMRAAAEAILAPQCAALVAATPRPFLQPIYDLESPRLAVGRAALIGDAAFVVRPHPGAGVTKAAEDAITLAALLDGTDDVPAALVRFAARRQPAGARMIERARHLGAYLQAQRRTEAERAAAERHRTPEAVMAETATLDF